MIDGIEIAITIIIFILVIWIWSIGFLVIRRLKQLGFKKINIGYTCLTFTPRELRANYSISDDKDPFKKDKIIRPLYLQYRILVLLSIIIVIIFMFIQFYLR